MSIFDLFKSKSQAGGKYVTEQQFKTNSAKQVQLAPQTLAQLRKIGVAADNKLKLEYFFYTNTLVKAKVFSDEIAKHGYTTRYGESKGNSKEFIITGWTIKMKMDEATVCAWAKSMCELGYKFDCDFDGWGTSPDMAPNKK